MNRLLVVLLLLACGGSGTKQLSAAAIDDYYQGCATAPCQTELTCRSGFTRQFCSITCAVDADCQQLGQLTRCLDGTCVTKCSSSMTTTCPSRATCDIGFEYCVPQ